MTMTDTRRPVATKRQQRGAALLVMMLVLLVAATAVLVSRLGTTELHLMRANATQNTLAVARQAILDYAALRPDMVPGSPAVLPCPDLGAGGGFAEGDAHTTSCGAAGVTVLGRVPWRTLGIAPPRDESASCLWYVVSGGWKEAGGATATLVNADTYGQLQLWDVDTGVVVEGAAPADRVVAMLIAPMDTLPGQNRPAAAGSQCSANFSAANFLDADAGLGISNAMVSGTVDAIDALAVVAGQHETHNDRVATISRADVARAIEQRPDYRSSTSALGLAVTECVAEYARNNGGGAGDQRLPWPAPLDLSDYRPDAAYDDRDAGELAGRLPDVVDDSNAQTGNPAATLLSGCDNAAVPAWSGAMQAHWRHWKDHFFYVVSESHAPDAMAPTACVNCLTVNGSGQYVAVVLFAHQRLDTLAQLRDAPPVDPNTRDDVANYLEANNASVFPYTGGGADLQSQPAGTTFNDQLFCIDAALGVSEC